MSLPCQQAERIERIENAVDRMTGQVSTLVTDFSVLKQRVETALDRVDDHEDMLKGVNGDVGVVAKVANLVEVFDELHETLRGKGKEPGLIAAIDTLTKKIAEWDDTKKWIGRLIVGWFITSLLGLLLITLK